MDKIDDQLRRWRAIEQGGRIAISKPARTPLAHHRTVRENRLAFKFGLSRRLAYLSGQVVDDHGMELTNEAYLKYAEDKVTGLMLRKHINEKVKR